MDFNDKKIRDALCKSASRIELWKQVLDIQQARTMLEVGVWKGDFAEQILRSCGYIERYYMIDPWANLPDWNKPFNVAPERLNACIPPSRGCGGRKLPGQILFLSIWMPSTLTARREARMHPWASPPPSPTPPRLTTC